jgi:DNA polymerase-3 subunit epsilon
VARGGRRLGRRPRPIQAGINYFASGSKTASYLDGINQRESAMDEGLERMVSALHQSGRYEVLRRFEPPGQYSAPDGSELSTAVAVDVETTGRDTQHDHILQFSAVPFEYSAAIGRIYGVGPPLTYLEDPGVEIPLEITQLTGISAESVKDQRIDDEAVEAMLRPAGLIVAHNALFDRGFLERRLTIFQSKAWACTLTEVPWPIGTGSAKLEFLMYKHCGLFFGAHTAESDSLALIQLLATPFETGQLPMKLLLEASRRRTLRIWATGAPFDKKDLLKARHYQWSPGDDGQRKAWFRDLPEAEGEAEFAWLQEYVYGGHGGLWKTETYGAERRFSSAR